MLPHFGTKKIQFRLEQNITDPKSCTLSVMSDYSYHFGGDPKSEASDMRLIIWGSKKDFH